MTKHEIYVEALLEHYDSVSQKRDEGAYHLSDELLDLEHAIKDAELTVRQSEVIDLYYGKGYAQTEIADQLRVSQPMVVKHTTAAIRKIASIYEQWEALDYAT